MTRDAWNPNQYERFRDERSQPFYDLLALVQQRRGMRVVDLGCGTGELTAEMHRRLQARETVGIDSSESMLAKTDAFANDCVRFTLGDIGQFAARGEYDLVFSNAALQWVSRHEEVLQRWAAALTADGQLAVQVPANDDHPSHSVAHSIAGEAPFRDALGGYVRPTTILEPEAYATLLDRLGFAEQHVRLQVYGHKLESREAVVEWVKGTLLTDYQRRLPAELFDRFLARYRESLLAQLPDTRPYFYPFKRILVLGEAHSLKAPGDHARWCAVGVLDVEREKHRVDPVPGQRPKVREMLGDEHAVAQQDVMHRPVEVRRAAVHRQVRRGEVDADEFDAALHEPRRRRQAERWVLVVALATEMVGPAGVEQHDVSELWHWCRCSNIAGSMSPYGSQSRSPHDTWAVQAIEGDLVECRRIGNEMAGRVDVRAEVADHLDFGHVHADPVAGS